MSGRVVAVGPAGLLTYDPVGRKMAHHKDLTLPGYANNLVYYPPTDRMYYITRGAPVRVFEIRLDRTDFAQSAIGEITVADPPAAPLPRRRFRRHRMGLRRRRRGHRRRDPTACFMPWIRGRKPGPMW